MKTELRVKKHLVTPHELVCEVWYGGALIATVVGADGPGLTVISKHAVRASYGNSEITVSASPINAMNVEIVR